MAGKENRGDIYSQKSDFGCAICMRTSIFDGEYTGIKMKSCSLCHGPRQYCSKRCFKKDWDELGHKDECKLFASTSLSKDSHVEAAQARKLKEEANQLFKIAKYEEAISKYTLVKIMAIKIRDVMKEKRLQQTKKEVQNIVFRKHLQNLKSIDSTLEDEIKVCHRADPLENEMARLSAIAANNTAVTYNKMKNALQASAAAREALRLDSQFADRILPQMMTAMQSLRSSEALAEMESRFSLYEEVMKDCDTITSSTALFQLKFVSYKQFIKKSYQYFYETIDKEKKLSQEGKGRFTDPLSTTKDCSKWGHAIVEVSLIPFGGLQWVTLGIQSIRYTFSKNSMEYHSLRLRPADLKRSGDEVHFDLHWDKPGSISHVGSMEALKTAHREIILFINDLEREGVLVKKVSVGAGLFNLLQENEDPQKYQRRHRGKADKYILYPGHFIPDHCKLVPAANHIRPKKIKK